MNQKRFEQVYEEVQDWMDNCPVSSICKQLDNDLIVEHVTQYVTDEEVSQAEHMYDMQREEKMLMELEMKGL